MSPEAKQLLRELRERPEWREIVDLIKEPLVPSFKPSNSVGSNVLPPEVQERKWIYASGRQKERDLLFKLLTLGEYNE